MTGSVLLAVRLWGLSQIHPKYESVYFNQTSVSEIIVPWEQSFFLEENPSWILWADVYRGDNDDLLVRPWIEKETPAKNLEGQSTPTRPLLTELLKNHPSTRFVVNVIENAEGIHHQLVKLLEDSSSLERVLVTSDFSIVTNAIKELRPVMLYGSSQQDLVKLKTMKSLGLLPAVAFKPDVLITPLRHKNIELVDLELVQEIHRRNKKVFLGPLDSFDDIALAKSMEADGLFIADPSLLQRTSP